MHTDGDGSGDLVLDPTCGSGTTAYVAEQWGRRWITVDTSRVALALARARSWRALSILSARGHPEGQLKEARSAAPPKETPTRGSIRQGFVYERVPHITLKSIANNAEIDVIWERWQATLEPLRARLNAALRQSWRNGRSAARSWQSVAGSNAAKLWAFEEAKTNPKAKCVEGDFRDEQESMRRNYTSWEEWEIPREADAKWSAAATRIPRRVVGGTHRATEGNRRLDRLQGRVRIPLRQPYPDIRASVWPGRSPSRVCRRTASLPVDAGRQLIDELAEPADGWHDFAQMVLENLKTAAFSRRTRRTASPSRRDPVAGQNGLRRRAVHGGRRERRAAIFLGPNSAPWHRADLVAAARKAADAGFDVVIACAFNFDAHSAELDRIGRVPVLKARMNPDLHMADELKTTGAGNLFVVFGEPDIEVEPVSDNQIRVKIKGVDVFRPQTGEVESGGPETIALWLVDTDYNEESFFVVMRISSARDRPLQSAENNVKAEIDEEAWASLNSDTSRPFPKPKSGRMAVKVINHLGDEVMKVFSVR